MSQQNCNCVICAIEFNPNELECVNLSKINTTNFKICKACLDNSDPANDFAQARQIVDSYLKYAEAKSLLVEAKLILEDIKK
jgi:hypothetical protein